MRTRGVQRDPEVAGCFLQAATVRQARRGCASWVSSKSLRIVSIGGGVCALFLDADEPGDRRTYRGFFGLDQPAAGRIMMP